MTRPAATRGVQHFDNHLGVLPSPTFDPGRTLDAIVVSAARRSDSLADSMRLAVKMGCRYVALCSREAEVRQVVRLAESFRGLRWAVVAVPAGYGHRLLQFETDRNPALTGGPGDLSLKRNLGLLLAHISGWDSILFLDDDMRALSPKTVGRAVSALTRGAAVGMPASRFPDNSVVCHANRRLNGGRQSVFVSGSMLAVDCSDIGSYFPRVYNEDWLFLAPKLAAGSVFQTGWSTQLTYDPFDDPRRAESQEFGDVLAEGLVALLHYGRTLDGAHDEAYWREFLDDRARFVADLTAKASHRHHKIARSLDAAGRRLAQLTAADLAGYLRTWDRDRLLWRSNLELEQRSGSFRHALTTLRLADCSWTAPGLEDAALELAVAV